MNRLFFLLVLPVFLAGCDNQTSSSSAPQGSSSPPLEETRPESPHRGSIAAENAALRQRVTELEQENARLRAAAKLRPAPPGSPHRDPGFSVEQPAEAELLPPPVTAPEALDLEPSGPQSGKTVNKVAGAGFPAKGEPVSPEQRGWLMRDEVTFNPGALDSSNVPVEEHTPLRIGQDLQLKWNTTWWAATITGFEPDGGIRVRYFGWGSYPEEVVPRSDLQLDPDVRRKAVEAAYGVAP